MDEALAEIWHISDHHLGHANILKFAGEDGAPARAGFKDLEHMHAVLVERHNALVGTNDKVYFHGDVAWKAAALERILPLMRGKKRLILGNHDTLDLELYRKHFKKVVAWRQFVYDHCTLVCTHFPLHQEAFTGRYQRTCLNVHGHTHARTIEDPRYANVSVEVIDYTPVHHDVLLEKARLL
ncbi:MAG TPA: hypothetical protein EYP98_05995 [Planctomycetes bacterium]|nr:hypothetical protein [Planctomycetota bacterium]